jgi:hypothetical protein
VLAGTQHHGTVIGWLRGFSRSRSRLMVVWDSRPGETDFFTSPGSLRASTLPVPEVQS